MSGAMKSDEPPQTVDFQRLFEAAPDLYMVLTPGLYIAALSDAYCRATMIDRTISIGRYLFDVFPDNPNDPGATGVTNLRASIARALQFRKPDIMAIQKYDVRRDGAVDGEFETRYWAPVNIPIFNAAGEVGWILHRAEDVTERIRLREQDQASRNTARNQQEIIDQLRSTKRFLDAVVDNVPGMLFVKSYPDCRFLLFNRAGEELLGYSSSTMLGKNDFDFFPKAQADHFIAFDQQVLRSGTVSQPVEEVIQTRYKGERLLRTIKVPVQDEHGNPQYLLGFSEDITDQRSTEQQLRQAVKMEAVGQLTGGIAHDFNNLLGVVIGNLDIAMSNGMLSPDLRELAEGALNAALKGAELTRRLLAFSRKQPLQPSSVDLNRGLPQIATMLRRTLGEDIVIHLHPGPDLWPALVDAAQVDEAILNLAINARDAMPGGGNLTIETQNAELDEDYTARNAEVKPGEYVQLSVSDTGSGMSLDVIERCFEPFYTTKEAEKGTGLGLSMVYGFVKQSGGHIKVYSEVGHGTSVTLYFPRAMSHHKTLARSEVTAPIAKGECILIVEDNSDLRTVSTRQLSDLGYRTLEASDGKQALDVLAAHPEIALLFSDIVMPGGITGIELARVARERYPQLKILLTSGYAARATANGFHDIGGLDFLMKPFRKHELANKLRDLIEQKN